jgi:hemerythrin-like domain-containing protein
MELGTEIAMFLRQKENKLCEEFETQCFILSLAYLADILSHLKDLNISLQGSEVTVLDANEKIAAFQQKLALWKRHVAKENYANFPTLENVVLSGEGVLETVPD